MRNRFIFFMFLFLFLLCEATNFFFLRTRIKGATMPMASKPNTVIARAYAHKQPCSNCSNETTERDNCSADVGLESRKTASQAHLHLSTTVSTCPLDNIKFELKSPGLTIQFLRFRLSQLSLTSSHLFSITLSGHMRKKHILTETSPPSWTLASVCKS